MTHRLLLALWACSFGLTSAIAQVGSCPWRISDDGMVPNPPDLASANGVLKAAFTLRSDQMHEQFLRQCYIYEGGSKPVESPTLRLNPGDWLDLTLTNRLSYVPPPTPINRATPSQPMEMPSRETPGDPCSGGIVGPTTTNLHFHGMNIPPKCHQDEVVGTRIENTDPPFEYKFQVPANDTPGMFWYHPHVHGSATVQLNGGAAGVLIVNGMEKVKPEVAGLPERILIIRQQFVDPNSWLPGKNQLTLNFQPANPRRRPPVIQMQPGAREFWRVANASSQALLNLQILSGGTPQRVEVVAWDGIPVTHNIPLTTIQLPPAGRAEFIMTGPAAGQTASFRQAGFDAGPIGPVNPPVELAKIVALPEAQEPPAMPGSPDAPARRGYLKRVATLAAAKPTARRTIYFAEAASGTNGPTDFYITVEGQTPKVFNMSDPPAVVTKVGTVEDWTVENRAGETHTFHIHQIHFLYMELNGKRLASQELRDTVIVPAWDGIGPYPYVKLRMDFRDPQIVGIFPFHCHILDHEDAGMMQTIQVNPR